MKIIIWIIALISLFLIPAFCLLSFFPNVQNNSANLSQPPVISVKQNQPPPQIKMLVFGDLMLDRYIRQTVDKYGIDYLFQNIKQNFSGNDLILANLEGGFTDFCRTKRHRIW